MKLGRWVNYWLLNPETVGHPLSLRPGKARQQGAKLGIASEHFLELHLLHDLGSEVGHKYHQPSQSMCDAILNGCEVSGGTLWRYYAWECTTVY